MIGTNNTNYEDQSPRDIAEGIKAIISRIEKKLPETKILLLAIFPRGDYEQRRDKDSNATPNKYWDKNEEVNALISKFSDDRTVYFLNINEAFLDSEGVLTRDVMPDLLHPQQKGYQLWAETMQPTIERLMTE
jgi:beta-glucosidase